MKAQFKLLVSLTSASLLTFVTGCWTSDAHDLPTDAGPLSVSQQCDAVAATLCITPTPIPANGDFLDLSKASIDLINSVPDPTDPSKWKILKYACAVISVSSSFSSSGFWIHSSSDLRVNNPYGLDWYPENPLDLNSQCHLGGKVAGAYSWGLYMNSSATCPDSSASGGVVDASAFDGITITIGGTKPGPTKATKINLFSVGTPEDPYREQKLTVEIPIKPTLTTYRYHWGEMLATCGRPEWFNPATIINITGEILQETGIAYDYDIEFGKIGFFKD